MATCFTSHGHFVSMADVRIDAPLHLDMVIDEGLRATYHAFEILILVLWERVCFTSETHQTSTVEAIKEELFAPVQMPWLSFGALALALEEVVGA